ncbi:1-acyl-sn-glycerol-3-phosphate acyltransferase [Chondromyces apiculatus]|uniref:Acyltransferase family protein n=1 Tax=Chondromyces apiculatus DSM 436 TaxID=1192034 RepID=A0A017T5S1_9BACT|nr:1-acyl-sn-glycerol-3-phosphate acyltransferase [Chondromyces apiculatus]EYF04377.1 acyltransferase family protein [Chondromyces apiculatus DSM 436]
MTTERGSSVTYWIGKTWLKAFGWRLETEYPVTDKFVLIAAPHTTGWDLPFMLATSYAMRLPLSWMGKQELFRPPFGWALRVLGGIPIARGARKNRVGWAVEQFAQSPHLILAIPAEGTRGAVTHWKSGFYRIALGAGVPIGLGYLDFEKKTCGIGGFITPTGDVRADMDLIRAFYRDIRGKYPSKESIPRLREEEDPSALPLIALDPA